MTPKVGDRVRHRGTLQWGLVLEVQPALGGSATTEYRVQRIVRRSGDLEGQGWWSLYNIDQSETP